MVLDHHFTRVDTLELKDLIYRRIGHQRADKYFDLLKRFFDLKLNKVEFDKSCLRTIGRENRALHNHLIRSIVHNACQAKTPPQKPQKPEELSVKVANGNNQRSYLQSLYGVAFPQSLRKCRSPVSRDRKLRDRPSPLGPLGKSPSLTCEDTVSRLQEQQSGAELGRPRVSVEEGEEVEQFAGVPSSHWWNSITAPLGISINTDGARRARRSYVKTCQSSGGLPDTKTLGIRLQKKLAEDGVGISLDGADLLNKGLDVYLKRIVSSCIGVAGPRPVSMLDFGVAMESNPSILGRDWPTQLEKICNYGVE